MQINHQLPNIFNISFHTAALQLPRGTSPSLPCKAFPCGPCRRLPVQPYPLSTPQAHVTEPSCGNRTRSSPARPVPTRVTFTMSPGRTALWRDWVKDSGSQCAISGDVTGRPRPIYPLGHLTMRQYKSQGDDPFSMDMLEMYPLKAGTWI